MLWEDGDMVVKIKNILMYQVGPVPKRHPMKRKGGALLRP